MKAEQYELEAPKQEFNSDFEIARAQARQRVLVDLEEHPIVEPVSHHPDGNRILLLAEYKEIQRSSLMRPHAQLRFTNNSKCAL